jgi:DNA-binding MarR family transcriptional regulator
MNFNRRLLRFGYVSKAVLMDFEIAPLTKAVYCLLCCYCGDKHYCFPSVETLSDCLGVSRRTVQRALKVLEQKGIITREQTKRGFSSDTYLLDDQYEEQCLAKGLIAA